MIVGDVEKGHMRELPRFTPLSWQGTLSQNPLVAGLSNNLSPCIESCLRAC